MMLMNWQSSITVWRRHSAAAVTDFQSHALCSQSFLFYNHRPFNFQCISNNQHFCVFLPCEKTVTVHLRDSNANPLCLTDAVPSIYLLEYLFNLFFTVVFGDIALEQSLMVDAC